MNKKIIGILICMLMIFAVLPTASSVNKVYIKQSTSKEKIDDECDWETLDVIIPKNKAKTRTLFFKFFERPLNTFLLLTRIR